MQHGTLIFGVELCTDVPLHARNLHNLHEVAFGVASHALHAGTLKLLLEVIVELVAVAMALLDVLLIIYIEHARALLQHTLVCAQTHCSAHIRDVLLLFHDVDDVVWSLLVHLAAVGVGIAQHVAGKLYHHHLHAQTDAESRDIVRAAVVGCYNLALDATLSESRTNQYAVLAFNLLSHVLLGQIFRVDECDVHLAVVVRTGVR